MQQQDLVSIVNGLKADILKPATPDSATVGSRAGEVNIAALDLLIETGEQKARKKQDLAAQARILKKLSDELTDITGVIGGLGRAVNG